MIGPLGLLPVQTLLMPVIMNQVAPRQFLHAGELVFQALADQIGIAPAKVLEAAHFQITHRLRAPMDAMLHPRG